MRVPRGHVVLVILMLALLAAPLAAGAQPAGKRFRVGVLCPITCAAPPFEALRQGLLARGYVEGRNLTFEYRAADGKYEKFFDLAAELVGLQVDVIFGAGAAGVLAPSAPPRRFPSCLLGLVRTPCSTALSRALQGRAET
jgi:putative ABC transport system substrate-binding protein